MCSDNHLDIAFDLEKELVTMRSATAFNIEFQPSHTVGSICHEMMIANVLNQKIPRRHYCIN